MCNPCDNQQKMWTENSDIQRGKQNLKILLTGKFRMLKETVLLWLSIFSMLAVIMEKKGYLPPLISASTAADPHFSLSFPQSFFSSGK